MRTGGTDTWRYLEDAKTPERGHGRRSPSEADLYTEAAEREEAARDAAKKLKKRTSMGKPGKKFAQNSDKSLK
jgi:hypothetical protein